MTVAKNVAFGLEIRKRPKDEVAERVDELLKLVHLSQFAHRLPSQLSGGQRQRMALARALAVEPTVLLLDEPFGALDAKVRKELREWLRRLHDEVHVTTVFVTHDQEEALEVADEIVVINDGRVEQVGTPDELYDEPANDFVMSLPRRGHPPRRRPRSARTTSRSRPRRCSPGPSRASSRGCCASASRCGSPCSPWRRGGLGHPDPHPRAVARAGGGQHGLAHRGVRRDRRTVDACRRWPADPVGAHRSLTPEVVPCPVVRGGRPPGGGGGLSCAGEGDGSLGRALGGHRAFDEDAADRALVGLLWDVPLGEA